MDSPLVLICSVALEAEPLLQMLADARPLSVGRVSAFSGRLKARPVLLLVGGMGKVNAAHALTAAFESGPRPHGVLGFGVGGGYPGGGADVGRIAFASSEIYGDEGVAAPDGWMGTDGIGIPLLKRDGEAAVFNEFTLDRSAVERGARALETAGIEPVTGPFVTVSCCSGTTAAGQRLRERFGAVCETMEGAAYAHVAALYGTTFLEVRGISNRVEDRDLAGWRLRDAAEACAQAAAVLITRWGA